MSGTVNVPNLITVARFISVPFIIWLIISEELAYAFYVFVLAGLSDALDGFLARRFATRTRLGAYLDPAADKALLVSVYVTLGLKGALPFWLVMLVVCRDFLIIGAVLISRFLSLPVQITPLFMSKFNTTAQILLAALILGQAVFAIDLSVFVIAGIYIVAATTVISGFAYLAVWLKAATNWEQTIRQEGPRQ